MSEACKQCSVIAAERDAVLAHCDIQRQALDLVTDRAEAAEARLAEAVGLLREAAYGTCPGPVRAIAGTMFAPCRKCLACRAHAFTEDVIVRPSPAPTEPAPSDGPIADLLRAQRSGQAPLCKYCGNQGADPFCRKCLRKATPPTEAPAPGTAPNDLTWAHWTCQGCGWRSLYLRFTCRNCGLDRAPGTEQKETTR